MVESKVYNLSPFASAILYGSLQPAQVGAAYLLWKFFRDSAIDEWFWWTYVAGYGQHFFFWIWGIAF